MSMGKPKPRLISNTFEPIALLKINLVSFSRGQTAEHAELWYVLYYLYKLKLYICIYTIYLRNSYLTAISPNPSFATITDEIASGIDVPTAMMTRPIVK